MSDRDACAIEPRKTRQVGRRVGATKVALNPTSWSASSELAVQDWVEHGRRLGAVGRSVGWWIGDWLLYGNERFGERYARAARITGYDVQTLMNMVYVASRFNVPRRNARLSFSHHAELAALDPDVQDHWLSRAESERLSVRCLRQELRSERKALKDASDDAALAAVAAAHEAVVCPECGCRLKTADEPGADPPPLEG